MRIDVQQISMLHHALREVLKQVERDTGMEFTITSMHRSGDSGVHGTMPLRAVDLRCRSKTVGTELERFINSNWCYDPARPGYQVCRAHGQGNNYHLHIQVHPNTKRSETFKWRT